MLFLKDFMQKFIVIFVFQLIAITDVAAIINLIDNTIAMN